MTKVVVAVVGCHRSGTSMVAGLLRQAGLPWSPDEHIMPASPANPEGYHEDLRVVSLHDSLLGAEGMSWCLETAMPCGWLTRLAGRLSASLATDIAREQLEGRPAWGFKDPRTSLVIPLWAEACARADAELRILHVMRAPGAVARSLAVREGWAPDRGYRIWRSYTEAASADSRPFRRVLVDAAALATGHNWRAVFERAMAELGIEHLTPDMLAVRPPRREIWHHA